MQCGHVDDLCKSPATLLLLGHCLCDDNSLQLHLFGHPGQASLRGEVDTSVVGRPRRDARRPHAAAHSCTPASTAPSGEEGGVIAAKRVTVPFHPLPRADLPPAMDLLTPSHLLICQLAKSCWSHLSWQAGGGVVAALKGAGLL